MKANNFNPGNLKQTQTTYEFEDCQMMVDFGTEEMEITIDGIIDVSFDFEDTSFNHSFGTENDGHYFVDSSEINIMNIYDSEGEKISLEKSLLRSVEKELEDLLEVMDVEKN